MCYKMHFVFFLLLSTKQIKLMDDLFFFVFPKKHCWLICGTLFWSWHMMKAYYTGTLAPGCNAASST